MIVILANEKKTFKSMKIVEQYDFACAFILKERV